MPFHLVETIITTPKSTTDFDSTGPPPDTLALTVASETPNSTTTATSETLDSTSSFKRAAGDDDDNESVSSDGESYFSALSSPSVILVNPSPTTSSGVQPTSINLPLAFKQSVQRAVQWQLRHYACKLDPKTCREVELSISDAVDLAARILERSHKPNMLPFAGTVAGTHLPVTALAPAHFRSATINSVLSRIANNVLQGSLKAIHLSGEHLLAVLTPRTATKLTLTPHTYEMARLDISMPQTQSPCPW
ncbi:hypothetical protein EDD16DRAFT_1701718 [Pisolithus croceorrhizus]|nr:hypothetical protein EV401DRAFT_2072998 [Pisolithus croceorrhizus]KAI6128680.1 hypothetical protein EDD16DRAFT_1701718 [Pisolithus croceorrhizus]KAI6162851.1 hypothetical protein EDD17DRAFT_1756876 [Pisolithus thermaeus]